MDDLKPGYQTTEFWVTVIIMAAGLFHKTVDPKTALIIVGAAGALYTAGRQLVKGVRSIQWINPVPTATITTSTLSDVK